MARPLFPKRWLWVALLVLAATGCTRLGYLRRADRETYGILGEKTAGRPWSMPRGFHIQPDPRSRFCDPTPVCDPELPLPAPHLYEYRLPEIAPRDPSRFGGATSRATGAPAVAAAEESVSGKPCVDEPAAMEDGAVRLASCETSSLRATLAAVEVAMHGNSPGGETGADPTEATRFDPTTGTLRVAPIPKKVWGSLPASCLGRMFEFDSTRQEYARTFGREPPAGQRDDSPRLALEDILELALINSREYQAQKETLYRAALALSLERYRFQLKFSAAGHGTDVDYTHRRAGGITVNGLSVPSTLTMEKVLVTGGDLLARLSNDVILTFNGPDGFAADIGSELLFDLSQSLFQRDTRFELLTQAERNVVYAARNYARYRKEFFEDLATSYYNLLLSYREIEITTQDYFSNLRAFNQGEAEYRAGRQSRIQVDQFEQTALGSRSRLISRCNSLETSMDRLKLLIGLPTETPINLDLTELEQLTLRDSATVAAERVRRARRNLTAERRKDPSPDQLDVLLNGAMDLARRMLHWAELREQLGQQQAGSSELKLLLARMSVDAARLLVRSSRRALREDKAADPPKPPVQIFRRTMELVDLLSVLVQRQQALAAESSANAADIFTIGEELERLRAESRQLSGSLQKVLAARRLDRLAELVAEAEGQFSEVDALAEAAEQLTQYTELPPNQEMQRTLEQVDRLLKESGNRLAAETTGLVPIEIDIDDAMLTALVQRFDLINQRGALADTWRDIKLAGDDLKSILNLHASHAIRTEHNRPFDFTFDESQTNVSLSFDAPLNRKSQRNTFRRSLINYNAALRNLMAAEDNVKLDVRNRLRTLQLQREQHEISVASAALAYERVVSTRLQLQLGVQDVAARDFLEAQQDYTTSLSAVASDHIGYILDRIRLFVDLEELEVDQYGFWPELYNDDFQPAPAYQLPPYALPGYGWLAPGPLYSRRMKRMLHIPAGCSSVFRPKVSTREGAAPLPEGAAPLPEVIPAPKPIEEVPPPLPEPDVEVPKAQQPLH